MKDNSKHQTDINKSILLCWKCGFPNKIGDIYCMFCHAMLSRKLNFISYIERFFNQMKWGIRLAEEKNKYKSQRISRFITLIAGMILFSAGSYLFINAILTGSFYNWMISLLFLIYGTFSIRFFLSSK